MEILIHNADVAEHIRDSDVILWKLATKKVRIFFLSLVGFGIVCLISGIKQGAGTSVSTFRLDSDTHIGYTTKTVYNYSLNFGFGIASILIFFYFLFIFVKQKKSLDATVDLIYNRYKSTKATFTLKITGEEVYYEDPESTRAERWIIFSSYKIYQDYLFLFHNHYFLTAMPIPLKQIAEADVTTLLSFVRSRLKEKRI